ncbi:MAG: hypothetical protein GY926_22170 [bacterium]|nr:hypothetical protein [bacterium]
MSTGLWAYVTRLATEDERSVHETMTRLMLSGIGQIAKDDLREGRTPLHERAVHIRELETALAVAFETCTENCVSPEHANPALARPIMDAWIPASDNEPNAEEASWS